MCLVDTDERSCSISVCATAQLLCYPVMLLSCVIVIYAGKVVDRHWYNRNKHIFPASRWEVYDPDTNYETYTIHGYEVL